MSLHHDNEKQREAEMKKIQKLFLTLTVITTLFTIEMIWIGPGESPGQTKGKTLFQGTLRDPFSLPSGIRPLSKEGTVQGVKGVSVIPDTPPAETPLKLKAILISDHIRLASIDRMIVSIGDSIRDEKVVEIKPDRVILEKGGKKRTILLDQSPLKLTVEER